MTPLFFLVAPALAALSSATLYVLESEDVKHLGIYFWK
ncbi:putative integral membrane protein [Lactococcus cremoris]|nr:putative integral membrane protein [Lactococcus cremoris]KZK49123.1 putative integral membrane protein [Lactococcus cremoris]